PLGTSRDLQYHPMSALSSRTSGVFRPLTEGSRSIRTGLYVATLEVPRDARPIVAAAGSGSFRPVLRQRRARRTGARAGGGTGAGGGADDSTPASRAPP